MSAVIASRRVLPAEGHTVFVLRVCPPQAGGAATTTSEAWEVERRFNAFAELHAALSVRAEALVRGASLPPKRYFGRFDPGFLDERQNALQAYLDALLAKGNSAWRNADVRRFLGMNDDVALAGRDGGGGGGRGANGTGTQRGPGQGGPVQEELTPEEREKREAERLAFIVNYTAGLMINVSGQEEAAAMAATATELGGRGGAHSPPPAATTPAGAPAQPSVTKDAVAMRQAVSASLSEQQLSSRPQAGAGGGQRLPFPSRACLDPSAVAAARTRSRSGSNPKRTRSRSRSGSGARPVQTGTGDAADVSALSSASWSPSGSPTQGDTPRVVAARGIAPLLSDATRLEHAASLDRLAMLLSNAHREASQLPAHVHVSYVVETLDIPPGAHPS